jgi:hypothetical protein
MVPLIPSRMIDKISIKDTYKYSKELY